MGGNIDDSNQDVEDHEEVQHHEDLLYRCRVCSNQTTLLGVACTKNNIFYVIFCE